LEKHAAVILESGLVIGDDIRERRVRAIQVVLLAFAGVNV
jgi:hypothetical protein